MFWDDNDLLYIRQLFIEPESVKECVPLSHAIHTEPGTLRGRGCADLPLTLRLAQVGGVVINDGPSTRFDNQPYGGLKDSGIEREGVKYAIEHMTEPKIMLMRNLGKL